MIADGSLAELNEYIDGVTSGSIVVSKAVRGAVERHCRDLEKQSCDAFPYHFDQDYAARCIRFYPSVLRHSIGRYSGMPFELSAWQKFCTASLFGWKCDADDTRRFRKSFRTMARKNGKSSWAAAESIFLAGFDANPYTGKPESVSQVVLSATKRDQAAKVVLAECVRMRERSAKVTKLSEFVNKEVRFSRNDGEIIAVGSDKPFDGLNPHAVMMDELHAWKSHHRPFHDTMITGSASRDQPLISYITTAGDDRSLLWKEVYDYAKSVALGNIDDPTYFAFIAELDEDDDPFDEDLWIKANPNLGVSVSQEYLRQQARENKTTVLGVNRFTRYHGNRLVSATEKAFDLEQWDACECELSDWSQADAITGGVDLGGRDDLAAWALVARFRITDELSRYEVMCKTYIAEDTERDLKKPPFVDWAYNGRLSVVRHPIESMGAELVEACARHNVAQVAYDPYNAQQFSETLDKHGITPVRMAQNCSMFNEPIRDFMAALKEQRISHDGDPLLRWCAGNAVVIQDRQERWMFDKRDSSEKIDPIVATVMAFRMACLAPTRPVGSLYL